MGYIDGLTDSIFKKDSQGRNLFFPYGILGAGYIMESDEQFTKTRDHIKKIYMAVFGIMLFVLLFKPGLNFGLIFMLAYMAYYYFTAKKMTKNMTRSTEKLGIAESYRNSAKSHNLFILILLTLFGFSLIPLGIFLLIKGEYPAGFLAAGFGGLGFAVGTYMIVSKIKNK